MAHQDEATSASTGTGAGVGTGSGGTAGGADVSTLSGLVHETHRDAADLFELARQELAKNTGSPQSPSADPRLAMHAIDAAVAAFSAHLSVMEGVVYPTAATAVPDGPARTAALRETAREAAGMMRGIEQYVQGDRYQPGSGVSELRANLVELGQAHARVEERLLSDLEERLAGAQLLRLREDVQQAMRRAPTRPHPHLGHRAGLASRLAARLAGHWDHLLDTMDARAVAGRPVRAPAPAGLWGWYLLGRPTSDQLGRPTGDQGHPGTGTSGD
ncbi:hemerythrin domain-containing protein [Frankia sp. R43]|uniref:hemerythrin domain-containing protein n=1 Tax=Frankia sp. R43 TaxID=269536 RepID=UPI0006C9E88F|nr:hemerythrin domain-containing protein [Frankia sp. R43]